MTMSGRIKTIKPQLNPPGQTVDACAQAKCAYCGLYGALGQCVGCGAPNTPITVGPIGYRGERLNVACHGDRPLTVLPLGTVIR